MHVDICEGTKQNHPHPHPTTVIESRKLSGDKFPQLKRLRSEIERLYGTIKDTVSELMKVRVLCCLQMRRSGVRGCLPLPFPLRSLTLPSFLPALTHRTNTHTGAQSQTMSEAMTDEYVAQRNGRFVLPVKNTYKRSGLGIVHDQSNTGRTVYVEPVQVIEPTNDMKRLELELQQEEARIVAEMTRLVAVSKDAILGSLEAAALVDLSVARAKLGDAMRAVVPEVGTEGMIRVEDARHPVLVLRYVHLGGGGWKGVGGWNPDSLTDDRQIHTHVHPVHHSGRDPVGNDMHIDARQPGLVLTGPNAGGKTIVLKTLGLLALLVRLGVPVPARSSGCRVDFFSPILADIGDMQSVTGMRALVWF